MDDKVIVYYNPKTNRLVACLESEMVIQTPILLDQGYMEYDRMTVKEYIDFGKGKL